ncbi:hypothetical protein [Silvanigrella aquatica]|uniref:Uncharacterized protein n=1 Tax=Silvanigrella aquatica TaxID=1915309 RepID=A0A1L4D388_9BACT|nr:hypothetical protein [Silvanigrella aquatica]APJ04663.1 hypothetical protein AXG55_12415 [Silvanigrella aquatica]
MKNFSKILLIMFNLLFIYNAYSISDSTYVICVDINKNYRWLYENIYENKFYKVNGIVKKIALKNKYFYAFSPEGGDDIIQDLSKKCIKTFGRQYFIVQPANSDISNWSLFELNSGMYASGFISIMAYSNYGARTTFVHSFGIYNVILDTEKFSYITLDKITNRIHH